MPPRARLTAGWNLQISNGIAGFAAWLRTAGGEEVFGTNPDVIVAGGFFPPAAAVPVDGGWRVTGRTPFASGCHRAQRFMMPMQEMHGDQPEVDPQTGEPKHALRLSEAVNLTHQAADTTWDA